MTERKGNTLLSIKNLEKTYQGGVLAVKDVSFEVKEKEVVVIIGASGSGKSTVLRCVNQLIEPSNGQIYLGERQINEDGVDINEVRSDIGMVFQSFELFMHLTVIENIMLGLKKVRLFSNEKAYEIARETLEKVDMIDKVDVFLGNYQVDKNNELR